MTEDRSVSFKVNEPGERLDKVVAAAISDLSRAAVQRLIKTGQVTVNGYTSKPSYRVEQADEVQVVIPHEKPAPVLAEQISLDVLYEDQDIVAVNKPAGMVVHPSYGHESGTLVNAVLARCPEILDVGGPDRGGVVHRLDMLTSGLILVAKNDAAHAALQRQFKKRLVSKTYLALVENQPTPRQGLIDAPIGRDKRQRKRMAVVKTGRAARTAYQVLESFPSHSLVELNPETGRTHQLRVHMAWLGCPVVGDKVYGYRRQQLLKDRHFLHAYQLKFTHPNTDEPLSLEAPLPPNLISLLKQLRR
jgi:23S rRNA pseudouridine1911/1915/1917 synthase